jgi:NADH-quinone oxidoreductase subunit E
MRRRRQAGISLNGLTLIALIAFAIGIVVAYGIGVMRGRREMRSPAPVFGAARSPAIPPAASTATPPAAPTASAPAVDVAAPDGPTAIVSPLRAEAPPRTTALATADAALDAERARLVRSHEAACAQLQRRLVGRDAEIARLAALAEERRALLAQLADARADTARYRQIVVDLENNAPPPLLDGPGAPDDLKLIVGVGPVLERMLQQLGITTYRQIARWSEHDIETFDARLPEFHGRIRRDAWVTQARALHQSKYGERA